jgi:hypothetical protein
LAKNRNRILPEDIVVVKEDTRIPKKDRDPKLYYYETRHSENDWTQPIGIETFVFVNFLGTLVTNVPLELTDGLLIPTWKEKRVICEKMQ